jgi:multiple sugar transport system permease protein
VTSVTDTATAPAVAREQITDARRRLSDREGFLAWIFLVPTVVYIIALVGVPFFLAIAYAFSDVTAGDPSYDWAGLTNFRRVFQDDVFWQSLQNTFVFTIVSMAFIVILGKVLANILLADFRGKWVVRFLVLLPWTTPVALSSLTWKWLLHSIYSPIDWALDRFGMIGGTGHVNWLGREPHAMISVIAVHVWRLVPLAAVIMMVGLMSIPRDLDEAARVDGAGYWRRMLEITIPLTFPLIAVAALFGAIFTFTDAAVVSVLTGGQPTNSTHVLASWSFQRGIGGGDIGQGAVIALFLFPMLLAAAVLILRAVRRMETL